MQAQGPLTLAGWKLLLNGIIHAPVAKAAPSLVPDRAEPATSLSSACIWEQFPSEVRITPLVFFMSFRPRKFRELTVSRSRPA